jgi:hypothetical protein
MRIPETAELLALAESGERVPERVRALLGAAFPGEDLEDDTPGARNRRLIALRRTLFGRRIACVAACDRCGALLEMELDTEGLLAEHGPESPGRVNVPHGERNLIFRVPTMADVERAALEPERELAVRALAQACSLDGGGEHLHDRSLLTALAAAFEAADPLGHIALDLACPACGAGTQPAVDLGALLWKEICDLARRLIGEVHALASAYGWSEADILALPATRRQRYLELL